MGMTNAEKQARWRARRKAELEQLRNGSDMFILTPEALRSTVAAQIAERSRDSAALNRLLVSLNIEPI